jgi:signal transduction histidine kinase
MSPVRGGVGRRRSDVLLAGWLLLCAATVIAALIASAGLVQNQNPYAPSQLALGFPCVLVGAYAAHRVPRHPIGWLLVLAGWGLWISPFVSSMFDRDWVHGEVLGRSLIAVGTIGWLWARGILLVLVPQLYPDGTAFGRRARPLRRIAAWASVAVIAWACLCQSISQAAFDFEHDELPAWAQRFGHWVTPAIRMIFLLALIAAADLLVRVLWLRSDAARRHRPIGFAAVALLAAPLVEFAPLAGIGQGHNIDWVEFASSALLVLTLVYGIVRHDALGFHTVVRRAVLYGGITVVAATLYIAVVGVFAAVLQHGVGWGSVVATGIVALSLQPVHAAVQRFVDRHVYGDRGEPYRALAGLSRRLGEAAPGGDLLASVAETVRTSLQLPAVGIELPDDDGKATLAARALGSRPGGEVERLPIVYEGHEVGTLVVTLPEGESQLAVADRRLLQDHTGAVGAVVQAARLADEVRASRDRLVRAREEERRRLRHDLHDGLGPTLASVAMGLDAAANRLDGEPDLAALLRDLDQALQEAIADIRRLVQGLRPPALDDLGLVSALREQAHDLSSRSAGAWPLIIDVSSDGDLPPLSAAVEVAAYRIAVEAMTNVLRHARARRCCVRLAAGESLHLVVEDDGRGVDPERPPGVGMESMRVRAEELGGTLWVEPRQGGGTVVAVVLPLHDRAIV